jgi:hypothetical protein
LKDPGESGAGSFLEFGNPALNRPKRALDVTAYCFDDFVAKLLPVKHLI